MHNFDGFALTEWPLLNETYYQEGNEITFEWSWNQFSSTIFWWGVSDKWAFTDAYIQMRPWNSFSACHGHLACTHTELTQPGGLFCKTEPKVNCGVKAPPFFPDFSLLLKIMLICAIKMLTHTIQINFGSTYVSINSFLF